MKRIAILLLVFITITFTSCGYSEEDVIAAQKQGYEAGYEAGFKDGYAALKPVARPTSGTILSGAEFDESEITVTADSSSDYVVSLKSYWGLERVAFYVRAGETVTIGVPADYLYVYFACGEKWYGYGKGLMFGEDTIYSKDDEFLDFTQYAWEYTLYPVTNGNFTESPSNENEFF